MPNTPKDNWDKADVILRPVGGLLTALAVAGIGFQFNAQQADDADMRFYAEFLARREESDTSLRRDMFNAALKAFVEPRSARSPKGRINEELEIELLNLELLVFNFHESIDLGPLFKDVYARIRADNVGTDAYRERLEALAKEVTDKQIASLEADRLEGELVDLDASVQSDGMVLNDPPPIITGDLPKVSPGQRSSVTGAAAPNRHFEVRVLEVFRERREVKLDLQVRTPNSTRRQGFFAKAPGDSEEATYVRREFTVGFADLPMIDNTRLTEGYRCAVVLRQFDDKRVGFTLVYFPTSRSAFKDKPGVDELLHDVRRIRQHLAQDR